MQDNFSHFTPAAGRWVVPEFWPGFSVGRRKKGLFLVCAFSLCVCVCVVVGRTREFVRLYHVLYNTTLYGACIGIWPKNEERRSHTDTYSTYVCTPHLIGILFFSSSVVCSDHTSEWRDDKVCERSPTTHVSADDVLVDTLHEQN